MATTTKTTSSSIANDQQPQFQGDGDQTLTKDPSLWVPNPQCKTTGSVANMLSSTPEANHSSIKIAVNHADWVDCDDHLMLSDDEYPTEQPPIEDGLLIPILNLKHKGSVVDMLMSGPVESQKYERRREVARVIRISPAGGSEPESDTEQSQEHTPEDRDLLNDRRSNFSMMANAGSRNNVGSLCPQREQSRVRISGYSAFRATMVDPASDDLTDRDRVNVTLRSDAFTYDKEHDTFTISLSNVEIVRQNDILGKLTIKVNANQINRTTSSRPEDEMDDQYVGDALDEILQNY